MTHHTDVELLPCPFCCAGITRIRENGKMWTGGDPTSVSVMHHCEPVDGQPSRAIERVGRDMESAVAAWNLRAPAAPVPQGLVKNPDWQIETCHRMFDRMGIERDDGEDFYTVWGRVCLAFEKVANLEIHIPLCGDVDYKQVATATQPPEAAPVQLPKPVANFWQHGETGRTRVVMPDAITDCDAGWQHVGALYTEQQVRELLVKHGIKVET